jgi:hypothetical protein
MTGSALLALAITALLAPGDAPEGRSIEVFILAGQSNMEGRASCGDLPVAIRGVQPAVLFYYADRWGLLAPGSSERPAPPDGFGPEISFGHELARADPARRFALIKHTRGGTSLAADWAPRHGREFHAMREKTRRALEELRASGHEPRLRGFVWMQGEKDAAEKAAAEAYEQNLRALVREVRSVFGEPTLPIVLGRINAPDRAYRDRVRKAQDTVARGDPHAACIDTDDLKLSDGIHYDAAALVELGRRFAGKAMELARPGAANPPTGR